MVAGLAIGRLGAAVDPPRRLAIALAAWGLAHAAVGVSGQPAVLGLLLLVAGASIAPTFVSANGMLDDLAPAGTLTEAFTWTSTGIAMGIAAGSAVAGVVVDTASPAVAMAALGAGGVLAALVVRAAATGPCPPAHRPPPEGRPQPRAKLYSATASGRCALAVPPAPVAELVDAQG